MNIQPYLFFDGCCEQALEFYRDALGIELKMLMRYRDSPEPLPPEQVPPGSEDKVMHARFRLGDTFVMASDATCPEYAGFQGFSLSISVANEAEAERVFTALADGGQIQMPLEKTFWTSAFGMLTDRFGVGWMVNVETAG